MLYERWRVVATNFAGEVALVEHGSRRRWTFAQLTAESEKATDRTAPVAFPAGNSAAFVIEVLRAWRSGQTVCPLEPEQATPTVSPPPDSCAHLKTTSATTGHPRLVAFTAAQLAADPANLLKSMGLRRDWPNVATISLAHSYGFSSLVLPLLLHGIPLILAPSHLPEVLRECARGWPDLTLAAVPALWKAWHEAAAIPDNVRLAISAGAPLPLALERTIHATRGLKIHNFYGSTECGGIAYDGSEKPRDQEAFVGTAVDGVTLAVAGDGCLEVRGPAVGETYWPEPDDGLGDGRFLTSDLAEIETDQIFLRGRATDRINVAGRKVQPERIERALRAHAGVRECLVFGTPEDAGRREEKIVAVVVADGPQAADLKQHLNALLADWEIPREWWFVESLQPNARGKISRTAWRERYARAKPRSA